jgi:probable phosphoglycerate mutase
LSRALETAELIGRELAVEVRVDERLAEADRGRWEGRTWQEIAAAEPEAYAAWRAAGGGFRFPGGESLAEQRDRVVAALGELDRRHDREPVLVVCHGGSIRAALCHSSGRGLDAFHAWDVPNGALIRL